MSETAISLDLPHGILDAFLPRGDQNLLERVQPPRRGIPDKVNEGESSFA